MAIKNKNNNILQDYFCNWVEPFILLNNSDGCYRVQLSKIIYCRSHNSSSVFHLTGTQKIVVSKAILYYEQLLNAFGFVRIHHNTIVNTAHINHTNKGEESSELTLVTGEKLIISRAKKKEVIAILKNMSIEGLLGYCRPFDGQNIQAKPQKIPV